MLTIDQIQPMKDRVLVRPDDVPTITAGGIHIPETVNADNPNYYTMTGTVLKVGPGGRDEDGVRQSMPVSVGDRVVFGRYAGKQLEVNQRDRVLMLRASEIIGFADAELVQPGYQPAKHSAVKGTARPAESGFESPANMVMR